METNCIKRKEGGGGQLQQDHGQLQQEEGGRGQLQQEDGQLKQEESGRDQLQQEQHGKEGKKPHCKPNFLCFSFCKNNK